MLFDIDDVELDVKGVWHIGAHHGQEYKSFRDMGVKNHIFFEPLPSNYEKLLKNIESYDSDGFNVKTENIALGSEDAEKTMYVETANNGMSCSLLKPQIHLQLYPGIEFNEEATVSQTSLDNYVSENNINTDDFNFIMIDVQGYELEVFNGAKETLKCVDYIFTEVNFVDVYQDCAKVDELDKFLGEYGFKRVETVNVANAWGDAFYTKKEYKKKNKFKISGLPV
jgi:FkbM family methyltransferase